MLHLAKRVFQEPSQDLFAIEFLSQKGSETQVFRET